MGSKYIMNDKALLSKYQPGSSKYGPDMSKKIQEILNTGNTHSKERALGKSNEKEPYRKKSVETDGLKLEDFQMRGYSSQTALKKLENELRAKQEKKSNVNLHPQIDDNIVRVTILETEQKNLLASIQRELQLLGLEQDKDLESIIKPRSGFEPREYEKPKPNRVDALEIEELNRKIQQIEQENKERKQQIERLVVRYENNINRMRSISLK